MPKTLQETKAGLKCCHLDTLMCCDCPYWPHTMCQDILRSDALYWLDELEGRKEDAVWLRKGVRGNMCNEYECSKCGEILELPGFTYNCGRNFCYHCGRKMKEETE